MQARSASTQSSMTFSTASISRAAVAGVIAGVVMAMFAMIIAALSDDGLWAPPRAIAAEFFGTEHAGSSFAFGPVVVGMMVHMMLSAMFGAGFGVVVGLVARSAGLVPIVLLGMAAGVALWAGSTYAVAPVLNGAEVFTDAMPEWAWFAAHLMFGAVLGLLVYGMRERA